jgi:nitronate monooxygenase
VPAPAEFRAPLNRLRLPVIGAPLFLISHPELVLAQCKAGVVGAFPSLNARPVAQLDEWLYRIREELAAWDTAHPDSPAAPFAVNLIVHKSNQRWEQDLGLCVKHEVPLVITSLGAREEVNQAVRGYGGITLHDVINNRFARKAIEKGASGLVAVGAGAGGHAGTLSPFALISEIREWFPGLLAVSGAIATGASILGALAMGGDAAYIGSAFIATEEANAEARYKQMIVECAADDIVYTDLFTGVHGNYLRPSIVAAGLDPERLPQGDTATMDFGGGGFKAWRDVWGSGQGIGSVKERVPVAALVERLAREYERAKRELAGRMALRETR